MNQPVTDLPADTFADPVLSALRTSQHSFAIRRGNAAVRYPVDVTPFAALTNPTDEAMAELRSLMEVGEYVWVTADKLPTVSGLANHSRQEVTQMVLPLTVELPPSSSQIVTLSGSNAVEMVALTDAAFPGFFRPQTYRMGRYYGIREAGQLIAMSGERFAMRGSADGKNYIEVSGVCTHPAHRGRGLAASLISRVVEAHRGESVVSFLHVSADNLNAIALYQKLGFHRVRNILLNKLVRTA